MSTRRNQRFRKVLPFVVVIVLGAPWTLLVHESSHAVCAIAGGGDVTAFQPWPHRSTRDGRWLLGSTSTRGVSELWKRRSHAAPMVESLFFAALWGLLGLRWRVFWVLAAWELLDLGNWLRGFLGWGSTLMDGARWRTG